MKKRLAISLVLGIGLSAAALYFAFRNVPVGDLAHYLGSINYLWMLPAVMLVIASFVLRAVRWRLILASVRDLPLGRAFHPMMIGFMINCVLPGRLGEIVRPVLLRQKEGIPFGTGLATVAAERFFDLLFMVILFTLVAGTIRIDPDLTIPFGDYQLNKSTLETLGGKMAAGGVIMLAGFVLVIVNRSRRVLSAIILAVPRPLAALSPSLSQAVGRRLSQPLARLLETVAGGLGLLRSPQRIIICCGHTLAIWGLLLLSYYVLSWGTPGIRISLLEMGATMVIIAVFIALPSIPGWWGLWEAGGIFGLSLFGVPVREAAGFTLANHAAQIFPVIAVGIASAVITSVTFRQITRVEAELPRPGEPEAAIDSPAACETEGLSFRR